MRRRVLTPLQCLALALAVGQAAVLLAGVPHCILPGPLAVAEALVTNAGLIARNAAFSALNLAQRPALGLVLGIETALLLALYPRFRRLLRPLLVAAQAVPSSRPRRW